MTDNAHIPNGTRIAGRYEVVGHLGSGGMGEVYEVEHLKLKRRFALKRLTIDPDLESDAAERASERFLREARAAAATGHPGIVEVFDYDQAEEGWPFLVMEKLEGENLRERIRRSESEPMSEAEIIHIGKAILSALGAVHERGIIHRDIKPANVFLTPVAAPDADDPTGVRVKLVDFGLALLYGGDRETADLRLTQSGTLLGTPLYMSPEQVRAAPVDHRTDIYSTGTLLYECIAGRPPFAGQGFASVIAQIVERRPPIEPLGECSDRLRATVLKALAKRPEHRFADVSAMAAVLSGEAELPDLETVARLSLGGDSDAWPSQDIGQIWSHGARSKLETQTIEEPVEPTIEPASQPDVTDETRQLDGAAEPVREEPVPLAPADDVPVDVADDVAISEPVSGDPLVRSGPRVSRTFAAVAVIVAFVASFLVVWMLRSERSETADAERSEAQASETASASQTSAAPGAAPGAVPAVIDKQLRKLIERGDLERAEPLVRRQLLRAPNDPAIQELYLLVAIDPERERAYKVAHDLADKTLAPATRVIVDAVLALQSGRPLDAVASVEALVEKRPDQLLLHFLHAHLLRYGDRFLQARDVYLALLARWPAFSPAVDGLLQRLLFLDQVEQARQVVDTYIANAPDSENLDMLALELDIGERRYRQALDRINRLLADKRGRVDEFFQFQGDLELLLDNPKAAIAAYDKVGAGAKRDHYVVGALLHLGRDDEASALILATIEGYPAGDKPSRLGKLGVDAVLLALERGEAELARRVATKLRQFEQQRVTQRYRASLAFAESAAAVLDGHAPNPAAFPLGEHSPLLALLHLRGQNDRAALTSARRHTEPSGMHFSVVSSHIYVPLWLERARLELAHGDPKQALACTERVLRPRHYDAARGIVIRRTMALQARILRSLQRTGEASAIEERMRSLGLSQR